MTKKCCQCVHRASLPGTAHSCCCHPKVKGELDDPLKSAFAIFASVGRVGPMVCANKLNIKANEAGIRGGWFNWPWDFDPTWLISCDGFVSKLEATDAKG